MASGLLQRMPPAALFAISLVIVEKPASPVDSASLLACVMLMATRATRMTVVIAAAVRITLRATERRENPPRPDFPVLGAGAGWGCRCLLIDSPLKDRLAWTDDLAGRTA